MISTFTCNTPLLSLVFISLRCDPVYVKYQFYNLPGHCTAGYAHSRDITWNDSHVILLGTIDRDLLVEYLRGPPLVMEVHDRDRSTEKVQQESTFGTERRDELLGTHAFGTGQNVIFYIHVVVYNLDKKVFLPGIELGTLCV